MEKSIGVMAEKIASILVENEPSVYLYGSVVLGDFRAGWSDIDFLCLTRKPLSGKQAETLVGLRQAMLEREPRNPYYRLFEGTMQSEDSISGTEGGPIVYWGTSGQRIIDSGPYDLDPFGMLILKDKGRVLYGPDRRDEISAPSEAAVWEALVRHYNTIREHGQPQPNSHNAGWYLDTARCLYTAKTGNVASKTAAGEWVLSEDLCPDPDALEAVLCFRKAPKEASPELMNTIASIGQAIVRFADVLEESLREKGVL